MPPFALLTLALTVAVVFLKIRVMLLSHRLAKLEKHPFCRWCNGNCRREFNGCVRDDER